MIAALASLVVVSTVPPAQPLAPPSPPVRVWLDPGVSLSRGEQAHVFVQTSGDGNLIVLLARVDGSVAVLFPRDPAGDPFVHAGTYEIVGPRDRPALTADDIGRGVVLAAVSPDPVWFDEFTAGRGWNNRTLTGAGASGDPEATLTDVVQRMLGDGSFNYDVATYYVTPPPAPAPSVAYEPEPPVFDSCVGCDYVAPFVGYPYGYGVLATPLNYNCRWLQTCVPGYWPVAPGFWPGAPGYLPGLPVLPVHPLSPRGIPTVVAVPFPPQQALAVYTGGRSSVVTAAPPVVAQPRPRPAYARDALATRPRSRTVAAAEPVVAGPRARSRAPQSLTPNPQPLATRARSQSEVVTVAAARQRVLQRRPRPVVVQGPEVTQGAAPTGLAIAPPRERLGASLALTTAPAIAPVMMRPQLAGAPVNVRTVRTTAGMPAMPQMGVTLGGQGMGMAQTVAMPRIPARLRVVR